MQLNELWTGSICEVYKNHSRNESSSYHLKKKESAATHLNQVEMVFVSCTGQRREKNHLCIINRHFVRQQRTSLSFWFTRTTKKRQLIPLNAWCGDLFFFCCCFCFAFFSFWFCFWFRFSSLLLVSVIFIDFFLFFLFEIDWSWCLSRKKFQHSRAAW